MEKTIVVSENGMFTSEPLALTEMADIFCAALTAGVQQLRTQFPEEESPKITKELFDCLNHSFSKCLENAFPEYELHPEITEEVLQLENELIMKRAKEVQNVLDADNTGGAE